MRKLCLVFAAATAVAGCASAPPPPPARLLAAANPHARVAALRLSSASAGTLTFRPVAPGGWGEAPADAPPAPTATQKPKDAKP